MTRTSQSWIASCSVMASLLIQVSTVVQAAVATVAEKTVREVAESVAEQLGKTGSKELIEQASKDLAEVTARCGDEAPVAVERHGASALRVMKNAGNEAGDYLPRAINQYGSDAIRLAESPAGRAVLREGNQSVIKALAKHSESALPMIRDVGESAARALGNVDYVNGRRLIQMHRDRSFSQADFDQLLRVVEKYGDRACEWIWRNKKVLTTAGAVAVFAKDPMPFIDGVIDLARVLFGGPIEAAVRAVIQRVNVNLWIGVCLVVGGVWWLFKRRRRLARIGGSASQVRGEGR